MPAVLGIDIGFAHTGLALIEGYRVVHSTVISTQKSDRKKELRVADDDAERCQLLTRSLVQYIQEYQPDGVIVELPTGGSQGARANRAMGMATGVIAAVVEILQVPTEWVTPTEVKMAACGRRDASKEDVQKAVLRHYEWQEKPRKPSDFEHAADAAAAVWAAEHGLLLRTLRSLP